MDHQDEFTKPHYQKHSMYHMHDYGHMHDHGRLHDHSHIYDHDHLNLHEHGHMRRRSSIALRAVKRVEDVARRMSVPAFDIHRIEQVLDEEIQEETAESERKEEGIIEILRRSGEKILHSKKILLMIVVLNIVDCALVMTELILDIHFIKEMMNNIESITGNFQRLLKEKYPFVFGNLTTHDIHNFYNRVLSAVRVYSEMISNSTGSVHLSGDHNATYKIPSKHHIVKRHEEEQVSLTDDDVPYFLNYEEHSIEEDLSHAFHKASITILGILVLITLLKLFCYGSRIFKRKIEMFDGLVVIASFVLDLVYIKGILAYPIQTGANVLTLLVPWRVIRVVNSLIVAVLDEAHLQLKMVYKQKKVSDEKREFALKQAQYYENTVIALRKMCNAFDIPVTAVTACIASVEKDLPERPKKAAASQAAFKHFKRCISRDSNQRPSLPYGQSDDHSDCDQDDGVSIKTPHHSLPAITLYEVDEEDFEEEKEKLMNGNTATEDDN